MVLKDYNDSDFHLLEKWVTDADLLLQFAGTDFSYPISHEQILAYRNKYPDRHFYIGFTEEDIPLAFGEIILMEEDYPKLARILIGEPALRGKGMGRHFIKLLLTECKQRFNTEAVQLLVWDKNQAAIKCYQAVGFIYDHQKLKTLVHEGKSYNIHKMVYIFAS